MLYARASYSRIRAALKQVHLDPENELIVLCSASAVLDRFGKVSELIKQDGFTIDQELFTLTEGNDPLCMAITAANTISYTSQALSRIKPDVVVTIADRYETIGTAIASAYLSIPLVHIQGGEITGNIDEKTRYACSKLADIHLVSNNPAAQRLIGMGENPETIFVTGCPSIDIARDSQDISLNELQNELNERSRHKYQCAQ